MPDSPQTTKSSFSIIMPSLNGRSFLQESVQSILTQQGRFDLELIVIDGGSQDGTLEYLQSLAGTRLRWISEPDRGQAAAINKGLAQAKGDIVAWLNTDDCYAPNALTIVADALEKNPESQWIVGHCDIIDESGKTIRDNITRYKNRHLETFSYKALLRLNMISQPAVFWRREFGQSIGPLDEQLHWTMDYDLWLRFAKRCPPLILGQTLAHFRVHGSSKSAGGYAPQFREGYAVACRHSGEDRLSRIVHRINVEKIIWGYRLMRWLGR